MLKDEHLASRSSSNRQSRPIHHRKKAHFTSQPSHRPNNRLLYRQSAQHQSRPQQFHPVGSLRPLQPANSQLLRQQALALRQRRQPTRPHRFLQQRLPALSRRHHQP
jgi:hypothetical protein